MLHLKKYFGKQCFSMKKILKVIQLLSVITSVNEN
jgi:hypothetical protein